MLINFSTANFRSIRNRCDFSLKRHGQPQILPENLFLSSSLKSQVLKTAILYGANASGKSNFVRALCAMRTIVLQKGVESNICKQLLEPFRLSTETQTQPTFFEIGICTNGRQYQYGFTCTQSRIETEWLYAKKQRMTLMFAREGDKFVDSSPDFKELSAWKNILKKTALTLPADALFLPTAAGMFAGNICEAIHNWFNNDLAILSTETYHQYLPYTLKSMDNPVFAEKISRLISKADFGIDSLQADITKLETTTNDVQSMQAIIHTKHVIDGQAYKFDLFNNESAGTKKVFSISAPLIDVLQHGKTLIIDELDASLHPLLVCQLIELFHKGNSTNAQMIATVHSPSILTETAFRRDQVWFVNKEKDGGTILSSLADFTGIRGNFARIVKDYLHGCFGGVPYIKNLSLEE